MDGIPVKESNAYTEIAHNRLAEESHAARNSAMESSSKPPPPPPPPPT